MSDGKRCLNALKVIHLLKNLFPQGIPLPTDLLPLKELKLAVQVIKAGKVEFISTKHLFSNDVTYQDYLIMSHKDLYDSYIAFHHVEESELKETVPSLGQRSLEI